MQGRNARGLDPRKSQCPHRRGVLQTPPFRDRVQTPCSRQHRVKHSVGVGEMRVSKARDDKLIAFGLGSCLGVIVDDPVAHVGGHVARDASVGESRSREGHAQCSHVRRYGSAVTLSLVL